MEYSFENSYKNLLVIDIETASVHASYSEMNTRFQALWDKKASMLQNPDEHTTDDLYKEKGAIYAEFGKVICISVGIFTKDKNGFGLRIKSIAHESEYENLLAFKQLIESKFDSKLLQLIAHNGKEFDFPYLCRRMLVNGIPVPVALDVRDKKPWEIHHLDTMDLWKFGDRKNFTSLELLAALFDIPSSKDDIDGSMVNKVYHDENDLSRIAEYCRRDVMVTAQIFLRLFGLPVIDENNIEYL